MSCIRPIIIVTGANSGVGFGICHRLLIQLSTFDPSDAKPQFVPLATDLSSEKVEEVPACNALTIIMACRSEPRASEARQKLLDLLDEHVARERRRPDYNGHAEEFRENLELDFIPMDMSDIHSVMHFANMVNQKYPYVSHLICNAGCGTFSGIDWPKAAHQILSHPVVGVTVTEFKKQISGRMSKDGLGFVWQCNVFAHYVLYRQLQPSFEEYRSEFHRPARVLWMSSLEASPGAYSRDDWQCIKTGLSYEATKYQVDLIATQLSFLANSDRHPAVRHLLVHPGIAESNMSRALVYSFLETLKLMVFYLVRWWGSPNHTITPFKAAVSAVHLALVPLLYIPTSLLTFRHIRHTEIPTKPIYEDSLYTASLYAQGLKSAENAKTAEEQGVPPPLKFGSETDRLGHERVGVTAVLEWAEHEKESEFLLEKCEDLYQTFFDLEKTGAKELNEFPPRLNDSAAQNGHLPN